MYEQQEHFNKRKLLIWTNSLAGFSAFIHIFLADYLEFRIAFFAFVFLSIVHLLYSFILKKNLLPVRLLINSIASVQALTLFIIIYFSGGAASPFNIWLLVMLSHVFFTGNSFDKRFWLTIITFTQVVNLIFYLQGHHFPYHIKEGHRDLFNFLVLSGSVFYQAMIYLFVDRWKIRHTDQAEKEKDLNLVLTNISEGYFDWHIKEDYEFMSPKFWEILGYDPKLKTHHPSEWQKLIHPEDLQKTLINFDLHVKTRGTHPFLNDVRYLHARGEYIWIKCEGKVVEWSEKGEALRFVGTHRDITKEKELINKLAESNEYLDLALEGATIGIWDWYLIDNSVKYDKRWASMLGLDINEIKMEFSTWESLVHPDDISNCFKDIEAYMNGETSYYENIHRMQHKDGHWVYILARGRFSSFDSTGKPIKFTGTHFDVTELMSTKLKLDLFFKKSPYGLAFCDLDGKFLEMNDEFIRITGYEKDEINQLFYWDLTPKKYEKEEALQLQSLKERGVYGPYQKEYIRKNGELISINLNGFIVESYDGKKGIWSIVEDISTKIALENEKNELLEKYQQSNQRLEAIFNFSPVMVYECQINKNWSMNFTNSHVEQITGYKSEELINDAKLAYANIIHPDDQGYVEKMVLGAVAKNQSYNLTYRIIHKNGDIRWVWERGSLSPGSSQSLIGVIFDVTERIKLEELTFLLSDVRSKYILFTNDKKKFFDYLLDKILSLTSSEYGFVGEILVDKKGKYLKTFAITDISWNDETRSFYKNNAPQGLEFRNLETLFGEVIKTGEVLIANDAPTHPSAAGLPEGHPPLKRFMGIPIMFKGEIFAMVGVANNLNDYKLEDHNFLKPFYELIGEMIQSFKLGSELETQKKISFHNAKLASIGELAAGVGHEINNPLTIIQGQLSMLKRYCEEGNPDRDQVNIRLEKSLKSVERISNIVKGLRTLARPDDSKTSLLNLSELLIDTKNMLSEIYEKEEISLVFDVENEIWVSGNLGRLQQVLVNLFNNAKDAMSESETKEIKVTVTSKNKVVEIKICDTGPGVPIDLKEKIFDPFFTTKEVNKGTGIGLALVSTIIRDHGGVITLDDQSEGGACFKITLKVHEKTIL